MKILFGINCYETNEVCEKLKEKYCTFMARFYRGYYNGIPATQTRKGSGAWMFPANLFDKWLKEKQEKLNGIK